MFCLKNTNTQSSNRLRSAKLALLSNEQRTMPLPTQTPPQQQRTISQFKPTLMIFNLPIADIQHRDTIFEDDFSNNVAGWEIIEDEDEKACIQKRHYFMRSNRKINSVNNVLS